MGDVPLFAGYEPPPVIEEPPLSADRRRTRRQAEQIALGIHPLTGRRVHLLADLNPQPTDGRSLPYRCGSCIFRKVVRHHDRSYPKCFFPGAQSADDFAQHGPPRYTSGAASDVRAWWPACPDYSAGDSISDDAARWIPDET